MEVEVLAQAEFKTTTGEKGEMIIGDELGVCVGFKESVFIGASANIAAAGQLEAFLSGVLELGYQGCKSIRVKTELSEAAKHLAALNNAVFGSETEIGGETSKITELSTKTTELETTFDADHVGTEAFNQEMITQVTNLLAQQTDSLAKSMEAIVNAMNVINSDATTTQNEMILTNVSNIMGSIHNRMASMHTVA
jgi:hypothetical protein